MMRLYIVLFCFVITQANSQCSFDPIITPTSLSLCPNQSDTLWASEADSYLWYKNNDPILTETNQFIVVNQAMDAGAQFRVVATIDGCSEPSANVFVSNQVLPPIQLSVVDSLSLSACFGDLRQIYINDPYNLNIIWFRNGIQLANQSNDTLTVNQNGSYSCLAFADNCPNFSQNATPLSFSFVNAAIPQISFNNQSLELSVAVVADSFNWFIDDVLIEGENQQVFLPQQNGLVTVEAIYNEGCSRTSEAFNYTSFVEECDHNPTISPSNLILCPNESDTLFTMSGDEHNWFIDGVEIPFENDSFLVVNSSQAGSTFTVEVTIDECTAISEPVLLDGWAFLPITVLTEGLNGPVCQGDTLKLTVNEPFTTNIRWFKDGNLIADANENSIDVSESGVYSVTAATEICPLYEETSLNLEYTFLSNPAPVLTYFSVSNTIGTNVEANNYTWSVDGDVLPDLNEQIISPTIDGNYIVSVSYANGCSNSSEPYFYSSVGFSGLDLEDKLVLYPNPAKDFIRFDNAFEGTLTIRDISGRLIDSRLIQTKSGFIETYSLLNGLYYFEFVGDNSVKTIPVILDR